MLIINKYWERLEEVKKVEKSEKIKHVENIKEVDYFAEIYEILDRMESRINE